MKTYITIRKDTNTFVAIQTTSIQDANARFAAKGIKVRKTSTQLSAVHIDYVIASEKF